MTLPTSFSGYNSNALEGSFLQDGYVIVESENQEVLLAMQEVCADVVRRETGFGKDLSNEETLNRVHEAVSVENLNQVRMSSINELRSRPWFRPGYFSLAKNALSQIVGNEIAMQRGVGLSVQLPNDTSSLLPIHADVWDGDSPFEIVLWTPLVSCFNTKSMYIMPLNLDRVQQHGMARFQYEGPEALFKAVENDVTFLNIKFGQVLLFSQTLMHGNRLNAETETRWSMNCRFKSVMSPYSDKKLGEFFEPILLRPATTVGLNYELPGGFDE
jgi:sporadic carbohydrate cluster 2OG-Fe(II) oxygenase